MSFGGGERFRPAAPLIVVALVGVCIASNRFHGDSRERIGLAAAAFWPTARLVAPIAILFAAPLFAMGWAKRFWWDWDIAWSFLGYPVWSFAQEYAVLGFVNNRLEDALGNHRAVVPWLNGLLFSFAHIPNPILMTATFIAGVTFTMIFERRRHLIPIALAHALIGVGISLAFADVYGVMSVGPGYVHRIGSVAPLRP